MALSAGTRIGSYEVVRPSGAGGMGEVFLARDVRLRRDVALNHANIATRHGLETSGDLQVLVMEYIDGDTLSDRLVSGAMPGAAAVSLARQRVNALDAPAAPITLILDWRP